MGGSYGAGSYGSSPYAGTFRLFSSNLLESYAVTATSAAAALTNLYDRRRTPDWRATTNVVQDIDIDLTAAGLASYSHVAFVHPGITAVEIYRGATFPPATLTLSIAAVDGDPYLADLGAVYAERYVRIRLLTGAVAASLGELFLGVPWTVTMGPALRSAGRGTVGNVRRDSTPAGYSFAAKLGNKRSRFAFSWAGLQSDELGVIEAAHDDIDQGAKSLILQHETGLVYWVNCLTPALAPVPMGNGLYELPELVFEEAL